MNNKITIRISEIFFLFLFTAIIFQNPLMNVNSYFIYVDEICFILSILYILYHILLRRKCEKTYIYMLFVIVVIIALGLVSNWKSDVNRTWQMITLDIVYFTKDFICFIAASLYFSRRGVSKTFVDRKRQIIVR